MTVLCLVEHDAGLVLPASREALVLARGLADSLGDALAAVLLGPGSGSVPVAGTVQLEEIQIVEDAALEPYAPAAWGRCLAGITLASGARAVIAAGTTRGHELVAFAAAVTNAPLAAGCLAVRPGSDGAIEVTRARWGGSVLEEAGIQGSPAFLALGELPRVADGQVGQGGDPATAPGVPAVADPAAALAADRPAETRTWSAEALGLRTGDLRARVIAREAATAGRVALGDARVVIGGGRGVGQDGFGPLEELAGLLGGTVGVSRVVTSAGWRPHAEQVGQTGTRIAPDLYIACGISGAIQHIVGCRGARAILAINTDPDAPIMSRATHAVIGDLHAVVPAIVAEVRRARDARAGG